MTNIAARAGQATLFLCALMAVPASSHAEASMREADKHFQHGVSLYVEADYKGALVEFNRAYALAPNGIVLFNIGETEYQLRDYAAALATFEHFLAETAQNDPHRALAESNVKELRTRVGRLRVVTVPAGAEISIDDRAVGKTPLDGPVIVGIGHLTVKASAPGRPPIARAIDVAAEDDVTLTIDLPAAATNSTSSSSSSTATAPSRFETPATTTVTDRPEPSPSHGAAWRTAGWIGTGVLAGGALVFGALATKSSMDLSDARKEYPTTLPRITRLANNTRTLSTVADSLAAAAIVLGGITLISTVSAHHPEAGSTSVAIGVGSLHLQGTF